MVHSYDIIEFSASVNGKIYEFVAYTTDTANGFCHHVMNRSNSQMTRVSYINRTWESFLYQSVLRAAIEKCPKADREELKKQLLV